MLAPERSRDALFDAMKARQTYATTGDRIILDVDLNGTGMGQRAPAAETRVVSGRVVGTAPIESITLFKNDEPIWQEDHLTDAPAPRGRWSYSSRSIRTRRRSSRTRPAADDTGAEP